MGIHCGRNCGSKREAALYGSGIQCNVTGRSFPKRGNASRSSPGSKRVRSAINKPMTQKIVRKTIATAHARRALHHALACRVLFPLAYRQARSKYYTTNGIWYFKDRSYSDAQVRRAFGVGR